MKIIVLSVLFMAVLSSYSPSDAERYVWASSYSYCDNLETNSCGKAGKRIESYGLEPIAFKTTGLFINVINSVVFKD